MIDFMDSAEWLSMDSRDKYFFVLGYMTGAHTWALTLDQVPVPEWPATKARLEVPVYMDHSTIVDWIDRFYEAGGNLPFSVRVLQYR